MDLFSDILTNKDTKSTHLPTPVTSSIETSSTEGSFTDPSENSRFRRLGSWRRGRLSSLILLFLFLILDLDFVKSRDIVVLHVWYPDDVIIYQSIKKKLTFLVKTRVELMFERHTLDTRLIRGVKEVELPLLI